MYMLSWCLYHFKGLIVSEAPPCFHLLSFSYDLWVISFWWITCVSFSHDVGDRFGHVLPLMGLCQHVVIGLICGAATLDVYVIDGLLQSHHLLLQWDYLCLHLLSCLEACQIDCFHLVGYLSVVAASGLEIHQLLLHFHSSSLFSLDLIL